MIASPRRGYTSASILIPCGRLEDPRHDSADQWPPRLWTRFSKASRSGTRPDAASCRETSETFTCQHSRTRRLCGLIPFFLSSDLLGIVALPTAAKWLYFPGGYFWLKFRLKWTSYRFQVFALLSLNIRSSWPIVLKFFLPPRQ